MYRLLKTSILGIKKLHKSEVEGGNRRPGFLFRSSRWLCWLRLPPQSNSLHSALALCYIEAAVAMEAVWAALADSEVEAGRGEEQLLTTVTSSVAAVALLAEA